MSARNQDLQANYDALMALPLVQQILKQNKKLLKKNKKLSKRNKCLENLIYSLPEFRKNCCCCGPSRDVVRRAEQVHIKVEPGCEIETEDEVRIINLNTPVKQNIQYEIVEAEEEEVEAEEEEAEAEEEEAEAEEEEAEAEVEEEVFEVTIKGKGYYTTNETDGVIYAIASNEDVGDTVGHFVKGKPVFY